ncbi:MAG: hypothetical protein AAFX99_22635 [Myxococcota bacterium]
MATKRPAKISKAKKGVAQKICPVTGKPMVPVKMFRQSGPSGMFWMVVEEFDGTDKTLDRLIPTQA